MRRQESPAPGIEGVREIFGDRKKRSMMVLELAAASGFGRSTERTAGAPALPRPLNLPPTRFPSERCKRAPPIFEA